MSHIPGVYNIFNKEFEKYATIYLISDTHFGEADLKEVFSNRPSDKELIKQINRIAGSKDLILCLGDVGDTSYLQKLRADCWVILGNHDGGASNYQRQVWVQKFDKAKWQRNEALDEMKRLYPNCHYSIDEGHQFTSPFEYWEIKADNKLAKQVFTGPVMISEKLILSHEPIPSLTWAMNLHGHSHQGPVRQDSCHYNCALEVNDYMPISLNTLMKSGLTANIEPLHRQIIDSSTERARKRGYTLKERKR